MKSCNKLFKKGSFQKIMSVVLAKYTDKFFSALTSHMFDTEPLNNNLHLLVKAVVEKYLHVRNHYIGKQITATLQSKLSVKSRQTYTKLIQFSGQ